MSSDLQKLKQQANELTNKLSGASVSNIQQCLDSATRLETLYNESKTAKEEWDTRQQFWTKLNRQYTDEAGKLVAQIDAWRKNPAVVETEFTNRVFFISRPDPNCSGYGNPACTPSTCELYQDVCDGWDCSNKKMSCKRTNKYYDDYEQQAINELKKTWTDKKFWCAGKDCYCQGTGIFYDPVTTAKTLECTSTLPPANAKIINSPSDNAFAEMPPTFNIQSSVICQDCRNVLSTTDSQINEANINQINQCVANIINNEVKKMEESSTTNNTTNTSNTNTNTNTSTNNSTDSKEWYTDLFTVDNILIGVAVIVGLCLCCLIIGIIIYAITRSNKKTE